MLTDEDDVSQPAAPSKLLEAVTNDLSLYVWCRRYRLVESFMETLKGKAPYNAPMHALMSYHARRFATHVAWCVSTWLHLPSMKHDVCSRILAYVPLGEMFPPPPSSTATVVERVRNTAGLVTMPQTPGRGATPSAMTPPTLTKRPREDSVTPLKGGPLDEPLSTSMPPLALLSAERRPRSPPPSAVKDNTPQFYLRPPYHDVLFLFARMLTPSLLNDEELNRYFGRFGQVSCKRVHTSTVALTDQGKLVPADLPLVALSVERSVSKRVDATLLLQDFIIEIDLPQNALGALLELRDPAIAFIAPHHPDRNVYCVSDLSVALQGAHLSLLQPRGLTSSDLLSEDSFVPELVVDGIPYWYTVEQLSFLCEAYGEVVAVRFSIDDRSGAFTGAAMLTMASAEAAKKTAQGLHGKVPETDMEPLVCGVLDSSFRVVSLLDPTVILLDHHAESLMPLLRGGRADGSIGNPRVWL